MARIETGNTNGHVHLYTDKVTKPNRASYTTITNGHRHLVVRDGAGKALRFEREKGADGRGHNHQLK